MTWSSPEPAILVRARRKDREATEAVLSSLALWLPFTVSLLAPSEIDVDDLCQEILIQVYRCLPSLRDPDRFQPWVWGIARNCLRDRLKRQRRRPREAPLEAAGRVMDPVEPPDKTIDQRDQWRLGQRAMDTLDPDSREVYALALQGFSRTEIASLLALPVGTVASRLVRARGEVRDALERLRIAPEVSSHAVCTDARDQKGGR